MALAAAPSCATAAVGRRGGASRASCSGRAHPSAASSLSSRTFAAQPLSARRAAPRTPCASLRTVAVAPMIERGEQSTGLMGHLLQNRIIFVGRVVNDVVAQQICTALMALEMEDPTKDIKMYINAGGGQQYSIMAVIDMMNTVKCDVSTVAVGNVASTATLVLAAGAKGKRYSLKNCRIMVNQPIGGCQGSYIDVKIQAAEQNRNLKVAQQLLMKSTGRSADECADLLDRESFLSAEQAVAFGIIDGVL